MDRGMFDSPIFRIVNNIFVGLIDAPIVGSVVRRALINIRYVGRRSGETIQTPVGYRRAGDRIVSTSFHPTRRRGGAISSARAARSRC
jgi:hypothetical protein